MDTGMARMMEAMHGSGDADFLAMMIPRHAGAIEMARLVLRYGHDPATRQLAEDIIASQAVEIRSIENRLALLRRSRRHRRQQLSRPRRHARPLRDGPCVAASGPMPRHGRERSRRSLRYTSQETP